MHDARGWMLVALVCGACDGRTAGPGRAQAPVAPVVPATGSGAASAGSGVAGAGSGVAGAGSGVASPAGQAGTFDRTLIAKDLSSQIPVFSADGAHVAVRVGAGAPPHELALDGRLVTSERVEAVVLAPDGSWVSYRVYPTVPTRWCTAASASP